MTYLLLWIFKSSSYCTCLNLFYLLSKQRNGSVNLVNYKTFLTSCNLPTDFKEIGFKVKSLFKLYFKNQTFLKMTTQKWRLIIFCWNFKVKKLCDKVISKCYYLLGFIWLKKNELFLSCVWRSFFVSLKKKIMRSSISCNF